MSHDFCPGRMLGLARLLACCAGMAHCYGQHTLRGNLSLSARQQAGVCVSVGRQLSSCQKGRRWGERCEAWRWAGTAAQGRRAIRSRARAISQRSLHNAPIFRLLLKVAVNGTHQCDFPNFCGQQCPTPSAPKARLCGLRPRSLRAHRAMPQCAPRKKE